MGHRKSFAGRDLGMDLGTANTLVYARGEGVVLNEPSVVAVNAVSREVISVGTEAKSTMGRTPSHVVALRPMRDGVIADYELAERMIAHFLRKVAVGGRRASRPRMVICVPSSITSVERRAVIEAATTAGAREVHLIQEPMAAAIGAGLPVSEPTGSMVVDIGGGTTEVAVLSLGGTVTSRSARVGGDAIDAAIAQHVRREHALVIGEQTAEQIKLAIGSAAPPGYWTDRLSALDREFERDCPEQATGDGTPPDDAPHPGPAPVAGDGGPESGGDTAVERRRSPSGKRDRVAGVGLVTRVGPTGDSGPRCRIRGRDQASGLPKTLELDASEVRRAIDDPLEAIISAVRLTLDACPPEAAGDVMERGIVLTGGGALLPGLDLRIGGAFEIPVIVADAPLDCVALGTGKCVEHYEALRTVLDATPHSYLAFKV
ncbi:rod shape-determining protein [Streptomyces sp. SL13]|uniref:Cell shape-determining protein MreB n=1 Tax=Streptantibioticus silvisoli TaxID=2705255 RepID=A0AA90H6C9_9ACTN|nr:rod shape-determining protein [Streptantibioticus silvisoli]MDI5965098.1 rod shape-determining protein [Streptantibioticus silvisoli]MDI5972741.1 rod shape-determining protein [Streptantibioticus silvisoli]